MSIRRLLINEHGKQRWAEDSPWARMRLEGSSKARSSEVGDTNVRSDTTRNRDWYPPSYSVRGDSPESPPPAEARPLAAAPLPPEAPSLPIEQHGTSISGPNVDATLGNEDGDLSHSHNEFLKELAQATNTARHVSDTHKNFVVHGKRGVSGAEQKGRRGDLGLSSGDAEVEKEHPIIHTGASRSNLSIAKLALCNSKGSKSREFIM